MRVSRALFVLAASAGLLLTACEDEEKRAELEKVRAAATAEQTKHAIEIVLLQDEVVSNRAQRDKPGYKERGVIGMNRIGLEDVPADFADAYKAHIKAWQLSAAARTEDELKEASKQVTDTFETIKSRAKGHGARLPEKLIPNVPARLERQLREADRWFANTLQCVTDGVIVTNQDARVRFLNSAAENLTGWSLGDAVGRDVGDIVRTLAGNSAKQRGAATTQPAHRHEATAMVRSVMQFGRPTSVAKYVRENIKRLSQFNVRSVINSGDC